MADLFESEARHHLRDVLMKVIDRADAKADSWSIADALLDAGDVRWDYRVYPEPKLATFAVTFTATDAGES